MKNKYQGFTLIELLIVITIITVLMLVTMRFTGSRIDDLKSQTSRDDFKNKYEQLLLSNTSSSYYNQERYTKMYILFASGRNNFSYYLENEAGTTTGIHIGFSDSKRKIIGLSGDSNTLGAVYLGLQPYSLGCTICKQIGCQTGDFQELKIQTNSIKKTYCFKISQESCKLEYTNCN